MTDTHHPDTLADDLLTGAPEIAAFLGTTQRRIYHLARNGRIPVFYIATKLHCRRSTLLRWIESQERDNLKGVTHDGRL